jgi:thiol-disulfide isomerase/thioredoxin
MENAMVGVTMSRAGKCVALIGAAAALYGMAGCSAKPPADLKSLAVGDMKAMVVSAAPMPAPNTPFTDAAGKTHTLAEFKGKVVLVNLWATWCGPCVAEMPTLAKLQADEAGKAVMVVPVSLDNDEDKANAEAFIAKRAPLAFYIDPSYALARAFSPPAENVPTTVLIDPQGRVRAQLAGGADWSGEAAHKVIDALAAGG